MDEVWWVESATTTDTGSLGAGVRATKVRFSTTRWEKMGLARGSFPREGSGCKKKGGGGGGG